jgi:septal ring factor EnvC (AmiA/AmiB activator)
MGPVPNKASGKGAPGLGGVSAAPAARQGPVVKQAAAPGARQSAGSAAKQGNGPAVKQGIGPEIKLGGGPDAVLSGPPDPPEPVRGADPGPGTVLSGPPGPDGGLGTGQDVLSGAAPNGQAGVTPDGAPAQSGGSGTRSGSSPADREESTRRQVEDAERVRSMQMDTQRTATAQAAQALAEEQRLTEAQQQAFERLKSAEAAVDQMTAHMLDLNRRRAEAQMRIDKREEALGPLIPIILRLSMFPVETMLTAPGSAEDTVRAILVLRTIAREAQEDVRALQQDREALDAATKAAAEVAPRLAAAEAARSYEADSLARQLAQTKERREAAEQEAADAARRAAAEAARANTLRSMLQILETQRQLEEARAREDVLRAERDQQSTAAQGARLRQAALARPTGAGTLTATAKPGGQVTPPVRGTLVHAWGDPQDGEPATGQSWQTEPGARVVAPCGGTVAFAEPFRGYGLLVIIDCGGGYHVVLSGMDQLTVVPGLAIQDGDAVGTMRAENKSAAPGDSAAGDTADGAVAEPPVLYFELRKGGRPINPAPWLRPAG